MRVFGGCSISVIRTNRKGTPQGSPFSVGASIDNGLDSKIAFNKIVIIATHVVSDVEYIARDVIMLKKGVIVDNAPPAELLRKIEGQVWSVPAKEEEVQPLQEKFRITNILKNDEGVSLRILSKEKPTDIARSISPVLEDYYLHVFGEIAGI